MGTLLKKEGETMGFNFRKSIKIGPARVNLSKSGIGYSIGTKGARISKSAKGKTKVTAGIPGTGVSYSKSIGGGNKSKKQARASYKQHNSPSAAREHWAQTTRTPAEKSWFMAVVMAVIGFAVTGTISFVVILILYAIIGLFVAGELPVWANWLVLIGIPLALALAAGYCGFVRMKPEAKGSPELILDNDDPDAIS